MDNKDYANLLIELESRMIEMENREKEWISRRHLKRDIKSSLAKLTKSIHKAEKAIMKQLENNAILAVANVRKSVCDIHFQTVFKLESLWKKRLPIRGEPQNFQYKMQEYLSFVIRHSLSDEIVFIWLEVFFFSFALLELKSKTHFVSSLFISNNMSTRFLSNCYQIGIFSLQPCRKVKKVSITVAEHLIHGPLLKFYVQG